MKLKVFKLKGGKLEFVGMREVRAGDIIVEGETSMAETIHLRESRRDQFYAEMRESLTTDEQRRNFNRGLEALGISEGADRETLRQSVKKAYPDLTDQGVEAFIQGRNPESPPGTLRESFKAGYLAAGKSEEEAERLAEIAVSGTGRGY
jgi:hypothetical protein